MKNAFDNSLYLQSQHFLFLPLIVGSQNSVVLNDITTMNVGPKQKFWHNKNRWGPNGPHKTNKLF